MVLKEFLRTRISINITALIVDPFRNRFVMEFTVSDKNGNTHKVRVATLNRRIPVDW